MVELERYAEPYRVEALPAILGEMEQAVAQLEAETQATLLQADEQIGRAYTTAGQQMAERDQADEPRMRVLAGEYRSRYSQPDRPEGTVRIGNTETQVGGSTIALIARDLKLALDTKDDTRVRVIDQEGRAKVEAASRPRSGEALEARGSEKQLAAGILAKLDEAEARRMAAYHAASEGRSRKEMAHQQAVNDLALIQGRVSQWRDEYQKAAEAVERDQVKKENNERRRRLYGADVGGVRFRPAQRSR